MNKPPETGRAARGIATLKAIAAESKISYKTVKDVYAIPGHPPFTAPMSEHVKYMKAAANGAVKLPPDLAARMILLKYETAIEKKEKVIEEKERLQLHNAEKRGKIITIPEAEAKASALAVALGSQISAFEKDFEKITEGMSRDARSDFVRNTCDKFRASIRECLAPLVK